MKTAGIFLAVAGLAAAQSAFVPTIPQCTCYVALSRCQTAPEANQSFCASQFAGCLGFSPYDNDNTTAVFDSFKKNCVTDSTPASSSGASYATATATYAASTTSAASTTFVPTIPECTCYVGLNKCQSSGDPNESFCASQFAGCLGFSPYGGDNTTAIFDAFKKYCVVDSTPASSSAMQTMGSKGSVSQITDGQVQAPTGAPVTQIGDGQIQAPTGNPVTQIGDGQVQAPTGNPVTQIGDGQVQAPTGAPVTQIGDGQVQAPTGSSNGTMSSSPMPYTGAAGKVAVCGSAILAGVAGVLLL